MLMVLTEFVPRGGKHFWGSALDSVSDGSAIVGGGQQETALPGTITGGSGGLQPIIADSTVTGGGSTSGMTDSAAAITGGGGTAVPSTAQISGGGGMPKIGS
jgi:hypothetical protein